MPTFRAALLVLGTAGSLVATPTFAADLTEEVRMFARIFATLEARDVKGYCEAMHSPPYAGYLDRVCQSAVLNRVKKPEECSPQSIAQQLSADAAKCLVMPAAEFNKAVVLGIDRRQAFLKETAAQGIDGERLLQEERAKLR